MTSLLVNVRERTAAVAQAPHAVEAITDAARWRSRRFILRSWNPSGASPWHIACSLRVVHKGGRLRPIGNLSCPLLAALLLCTAGCSLVAVRHPPPGPLAADPAADCTTSRVAPVLDVAGGVLFTSLAAFGVGLTTCSHDPHEFLDLCPSNKAGPVAFMVGTAATAGLLFWSAADGFKNTAKCREVLRQQQACIGGDAASCNALRTRTPQ